MNDYMRDSLIRWAREDKNALLSMVIFWHGFYARNKNPLALGITKELGQEIATLERSEKNLLEAKAYRKETQQPQEIYG